MPRFRRTPGLIGLPEIEVVELASGRDPRVVHLQSTRRGFGLWGRMVDRGRFVIPPGEFALLEIVDDLPTEPGLPRCVLRVRSDMEGEVVTGVSTMSVRQILADPLLRQADGSARLPLPNGARLRISAEGLTFLARIGGPPLTRPIFGADPMPDPMPGASPSWA
ncbi:hypothetical protein ACNOYE_33730 [Nannocystaceae bacterium ST9]